MAHTKSLRVVTPKIARAFFRHCKVLLCQDFLSQKEIAIQNKASIESWNFTIHCAAMVLVLNAKRRKIDAVSAATNKRRRRSVLNRTSISDSAGDGEDGQDKTSKRQRLSELEVRRVLVKRPI